MDEFYYVITYEDIKTKKNYTVLYHSNKNIKELMDDIKQNTGKEGFNILFIYREKYEK